MVKKNYFKFFYFKRLNEFLDYKKQYPFLNYWSCLDQIQIRTIT